MRKFLRAKAPDFLNSKWNAWGTRYLNNRKSNSGFTFQLPTFEGQIINKIISPLLAEMTDNHCSFCDKFPVGSKEISIDHFKPKSNPDFYNLVCQWENLYYCCPNCQAFKKEQYNDDLLRPDGNDYSFEKYFIYLYNSHTIEPHPVLDESEKLKAITTIAIFGLNDTSHTITRRHTLERFEGQKTDNLEIEISDFPYRFILLE